jgi:hypothetical protein
MGRRSKATEARIEALVIALGTGCTREAAARHAGIDRTTLYRWLERDAAIRIRVEKAEADVEVRLAAQIVQAAPDDWRAAAWMLDRRRPRSYGRAQAAAAAADTPTTPAQAPHPLDDLPLAEGARRAQAWALILAADESPVAGADAFSAGTTVA